MFILFICLVLDVVFSFLEVSCFTSWEYLSKIHGSLYVTETLDAKDVKIQERIVEHPQIHQVEKVGQKIRSCWWQPEILRSPVEVGSLSTIIYRVLAPSQVVVGDFFHQQSQDAKMALLRYVRLDSSSFPQTLASEVCFRWNLRCKQPKVGDFKRPVLSWQGGGSASDGGAGSDTTRRPA